MSDLERTPWGDTPFERVLDGNGRVWMYCTHCAGYQIMYDALAFQRIRTAPFGMVRLTLLLPWVAIGGGKFAKLHYACWMIRKELNS